MSSDAKPPAPNDEPEFESDDPIPPTGCRTIDATEPAVVTLGGQVKLMNELSPRKLSQLRGTGWVLGDPLPTQVDVQTDSEGFALEISEPSDEH